MTCESCLDSMGGGVPDPLETLKGIDFLRNTGHDPWKMTKLSSKHSMLGNHQPAGTTPFKLHFASWQMMAHFLSSV